MAEAQRKRMIVPVFQNKSDVQSCRDIKLLSQVMKVWGRDEEARLRGIVRISEEQFGFVRERSTADAIFALRMLMESHRERQKALHCVFID